MWGIKKTARKLAASDEAMLKRLHAANDLLPEAHQVGATLVWIKGLLLSDNPVTRELGQGAMTRIGECLL
jgi:hypothetical protein